MMETEMEFTSAATRKVRVGGWGGRHRGGVVLEDGVMKEMKGLFNLVSR